jgi:hypothetical protein
MPFLVWIRVISYWRTVGEEMTEATLQFLDEVEHRSKSRKKQPLSFWAMDELTAAELSQPTGNQR